MKIISELNCSNCKFLSDKSDKVYDDELNSQGGIKDPGKADMDRGQKVKLITLPGKMKVKKKFWCDHEDVDQWVTQHMWCRMWDATGTIHIKK